MVSSGHGGINPGFGSGLRAAWLSMLRLCRTGRPTLAASARALAPGVQRIALDRPAAPGWYMLEVQVATGRGTVQSWVGLAGTGHQAHAAALPFPLFGKRTCKRLLLLRTAATVELTFPGGPADLEVAMFRLVPVTAAFARSRLRRKLLALHPLYRARGAAEAASAPSIDTLWRHYCDLFGPREQLVPYADWLGQFGQASPAERAALRERVSGAAQAPAFSIVVIGDVANGAGTAASADSVRHQQYPHWQLILAGPAAPAVPCGEREHAVPYRAGEALAELLNRAVAAASGEWIMFLQAGDVLSPDALLALAAEQATDADCSILYTDEDAIGPTGLRSNPNCKPDWDIDLLHAQNYIGASAAYRRELVRAAGAFRPEHDGAQLFDLLLRCAEQVQPCQVLHLPRILLHRAGAAADETARSPSPVGVTALQAHLGRLGVDAVAGQEQSGYRVRYAVPAPAPLVTLIIPTRNGLDLLERCVGSIVAKTTYPNYELLIVDNGSDDPAALRYLQRLAEQGAARVLRIDGEFNYSALNNAAVRAACGELVGLVNNDVEVITPDWLTEMAGHALRPGVGAVGARLWYADDTLQHGGVILGMEGTAGHLHRFLPRGEPGYCARALLTQSFSAVTGACLVVRKQAYLDVGGLNEVELRVACNDIDFCLRLREHGLRNVWTPYAELYHHESSSRGFDDAGAKAQRAKGENAYLRARWARWLEADPAYNPNLSLDFTDVVLAWPPRARRAAAEELG